MGVTVTSGTSAAVSPYSLRYAACTASAHLHKIRMLRLGRELLRLMRLLVIALLALARLNYLDALFALQLLWF